MGSGKLLILVVDDEAHIQHVLSLKLRNAGYEVVTADNGEEGFDKAVEHKPVLVITDFQMPIVSGLQMCQQLKQHEQTCDTQALMLTARGFSLSEDDLATTNIIEVLSKPFSPREILAKVEGLIQSVRTVSDQ